MAYYHICPDCGATLDPGEPCDCQKGLPFVTVPDDYGTHKELYEEELSVSNIIKVKFLKAGEPSGRAYTYYSKQPVEVGDKVQINLQSVGIVTDIHVSEEEIEPYKDKVKFIHGKYEEPVVEKEAPSKCDAADVEEI